MKDWYTEKRVSRSIFGSILEYEYLYLNGELDIDCIYLKKRREHIGTYKVADMEALFPLDAKRFREYRKDKNIKIRECSWICKDVLREKYNLPENRVDRFRQI